MQIAYEISKTSSKYLSFICQKYLHRMTCEREASGETRRERERQAQAYQFSVDAKREKDHIKLLKKAARDAEIDGINLRLDPEEVQRNSGVVKAIELQLEWHRKHGDLEIPMKSKLKNKQEKLDALVEAIKRYNAKVELEIDGEDLEADNHHMTEPLMIGEEDSDFEMDLE